MTCFFCLISHHCLCSAYFFFFNYPAPTDIYTLSLHDALPISAPPPKPGLRGSTSADGPGPADPATPSVRPAPEPWQSSRSEEHTSELQSLTNLVCRLLLEKKKKKKENTKKKTLQQTTLKQVRK